MKKLETIELGARINRLLEVIEIADDLIELHSHDDSGLMLRQFHHMKAKFMAEFNELLAEHQMSVGVLEAAPNKKTLAKAA